MGDYFSGNWRQVGLLLIGLGLILASVLPPLYLFDFTLAWQSARELLAGSNPYARAHYAVFVTDYPSFLAPSPADQDIRTYYPPFGLVLFLPFALAPLALAKKLYVAAFVALLAASAVLSSHVLSRERRALAPSGGILPLWHLVLFPLGLSLHALSWGSPSFLLPFLFVVALAAWQKGHELGAGYCLGLMLFKPHLTLPVIAFAIVACVRRKKAALAAGVVLAVLSLSLVALGFRSGVYAEYVAAIQTSPPTFMTNASLPSVLAALFPAHAFMLRFCPCLLLILGAVWRGWVRPPVGPVVPAVCLLPLAALLSPFSWGHDYLLCIPFFYLCGLCAAELWRRRRRDSITLWGILVLNALVPLSLAYHFFVPGWSFVLSGILSAALLGMLVRRGMIFEGGA